MLEVGVWAVSQWKRRDHERAVSALKIWRRLTMNWLCIGGRPNGVTHLSANTPFREP